MLYYPIFNQLSTCLLYPTTGKVMDAVGVLGEFEDTGAGEGTEVVHRKDVHIVLIDLVLAIDNKSTCYHDVGNGFGVGR